MSLHEYRGSEVCMNKEGKQKRGFCYWFSKKIWKYRFLHLMIVPGMIIILLFRYVPMYGVVIAFKNYLGGGGGFRGISEAPWVGLTNFRMFFSSIYFKRLFSNTLIISLMRIVFYFPTPIILAIMINEVQNTHAKKAIQTITYMPYFLSWVVVAGLMQILLSPDGGPINVVRQLFGLEPVYYLASKQHFRGLLILSEIWKNIGYGSIVYLAGIAGVDQDLYEAARVDGANKIQQIRYITLPGISEIIAVMLILAVGRVLEDNFDQIFNLYSTATYEVADVFETYIYRTGITGGKYSYAAAIGLCKSAVSFVLVVGANWITKRLGSEGII